MITQHHLVERSTSNNKMLVLCFVCHFLAATVNGVHTGRLKPGTGGWLLQMLYPGVTEITNKPQENALCPVESFGYGCIHARPGWHWKNSEISSQVFAS